MTHTDLLIGLANDKRDEMHSVVCKLTAALELYDKQFHSLLNKVNAVTAYHRGGQPVSKERLTNLCNRQVEVEEALEEGLKEIAGRL